MQFWHNMMESKCWQNFYFGAKCNGSELVGRGLKLDRLYFLVHEQAGKVNAKFK